MVSAHPECGQVVFLVDGEPFDLDGSEHLCRDYVAWHLPPDRRHPDEMPWPPEVERCRGVPEVVVRAAA